MKPAVDIQPSLYVMTICKTFLLPELLGYHIHLLEKFFHDSYVLLVLGHCSLVSDHSLNFHLQVKDLTDIIHCKTVNLLLPVRIDYEALSLKTLQRLSDRSPSDIVHFRQSVFRHNQSGLQFPGHDAPENCIVCTFS